MSTTSASKTTDYANLTRHLLDELIGEDAARTIGVLLWDGSRWPNNDPRPVTLVLKHPGSLRQMFLPGTELAMAEAYLYDDIDIIGNIEQVFDLRKVVPERSGNLAKKFRLARELMHLPETPARHYGKRGPARLSGMPHSLERDRQAIAYHYSVSNDFYALYLDPRMIYSCAYFRAPEDDLATAQEQKLEYLCRKLRLQAGETLLDIGCGWGGLAIYAAQRYGVAITGITLSEPQAELATRRVAEAGLQDRVHILLKDYREMSEHAPFDKLVSVGMFEHVGESLLPDYFEIAYDLLKPGGVFLNHGIGQRYSEELEDTSFSDSYVFPDGETLPIYLTLQVAEETGFEVRDVENLREHYLYTLRHWVANLESHHEEALQYVDEATYRVWRLYMSGSAYGFREGRLKVYQSLLYKPCEDEPGPLPLRREDWYR